MARKKTKREKQPDYLFDVISAVRAYDEVRLGKREIKGETVETLHKKAVKTITIANNVHHKGFMSISKARAIMQSMAQREKVEMAKSDTEQQAA